MYACYVCYGCRTADGVRRQADAARRSTRYTEKQAAQAQRSIKHRGEPCAAGPTALAPRTTESKLSIVAVARIEDAIAVVVEIGVPAGGECRCDFDNNNNR